MPKHYWIAPHWIDYGEYGDFCYFQTDFHFIQELSKQSPHLFLDKWAVYTAYDGDEMLPPGHRPDWKELNSPVQLKTAFDFGWSGMMDEVYLFDRQIKRAELQLLKERLKFCTERLSEVDLSMFAQDWKILEQVGAYGHLSEEDHFTYIFKDKIAAKNFMQTDFFKKVSTIHYEEMDRARQGRLKYELGSGKCAFANCDETRIRLGVNCPRHHYTMMTGLDPDD